MDGGMNKAGRKLQIRSTCGIWNLQHILGVGITFYWG